MGGFDRRRGTYKKPNYQIFSLSGHINFSKIAIRRSVSKKLIAGFTISTRTATSLFFVIACIFSLILPQSSGQLFSSRCAADDCANNFQRALDHDKALIGSNLPYCTLLTDYDSCLNRTSRACRGDLRFHSLISILKTEIRDRKCTALIEHRRKMALSKSNTGKGNLTLGSREEDSENRGGAAEGLDLGIAGANGRCLFPYQHQKGAGGYRFCSMFGDPHLRTFEGQYETCRTLGAWPLIDNSYFGVQVTNDPVVDGLEASGIGKVTVIIKSLPGCTDQKMFEATKDFLPSTFVDGTTNSGEPNTNSISGSHFFVSTMDYNNNQNGNENSDTSDHRPPVIIRTIESDRHIEIHLRYISARIVIRRVGTYLTVAIKIPDEVIAQRTAFNTLQLCLTGCPSSERINYKEVIAYPEYYVKKWGARNPAMSREQAIDSCRQMGVTDFFFDSCVFDLLMTGDESFKESALAAMNDIRQLYPPYRKHYETKRSDLLLYDELAKLGREREFQERQSGHKRRQPPDFMNRQQNDDQFSSTGRFSDSKKFIPNNSIRTLSTAILPSTCLILLFTVIRFRFWIVFT